MIERRHYITALFLLVLPVVVIYALTNYGIEEPALHQKSKTEISDKSAYACQQKKLDKKEHKTRLEESNKRHLK